MEPLRFLGEVARMAFTDLAARPLRAVLSLSSFSSAVGISVVLIAAGHSLREAAGEILRNLGEGQVVATPGRTTGLGGQRRAGRPVRLRYEDVEGVAEALPSIEGIAPYFDLRGGGASSWRYSIPFSPVKAVARGYLEVRRLPVIEGRWFTAAEEEEGRWAAVLNEGLRRIIFPDTAAVGRWIEWRGRRMTVVGVVRDEALFPYIFFIPYRTVSQLADARYITGLIARPAPEASWERAVMEIRRVLAGLGGFDPLDENALEIEDNRQFTTQVSAFSAALHLLVVTIAGVSLLLGGLGVANMMVISVTERTREIGLRKALGATPRSIFLQVLCEALFIIALGGAAGLALGALACAAVGELEMSSRYAARVRFDLAPALFSLAGLGAVAVLAGILPARRAAALPAAEALRWE
jgi:putative ABC transport system permease protein